ncbi:MAG: acyltransferase family protein [Synechococcaceae cyanobacterium]|nr:acyltransferase family protein [Synechococcaceae cyanobacterium]
MTAPSRDHLAYRPELDGLRAVAVLVVILNHLNPAWLPSGYLGVDLFFVISGYVVTGSLATRRWTGWRSTLSRFYQRRFRRLLPALLLCIATTTLLFAAVVHPGDDVFKPLLRTGMAALFGISNLYLLRQGNDYFSSDSSFNPFLHTWSLGVEEQFYLVWPLLLLACGLGGAAPAAFRRRLGRLCLALSAASLLLMVWLVARGEAGAAFYLMPARFWELAAGALAWLWLQRCTPAVDSSAAPRPAWPAALLLLLFAALMAVPHDGQFAATLACVPLSAGLLVQLQAGRGVGRWLARPLPLAIGLASYSLYLWHWPVIVLARWSVGLSAWTLPAILLLIGALSWGSFRLETRLRRPPAPTAPFPARALLTYPGLALLLAAAIHALLGPARASLFLGDRSRIGLDLSHSRGIAGTTLDTTHCFRDPTAPLQADPDDGPCRLERHPGRPTLYFEGDSHTEMLIPLGGRVLEGSQLNVAFFARGGCPLPWFSGWPGHDSARYALCAPHDRQRSRALLERLRPGDRLVLVSNLPGYLLDPDPALQRRRLAAYSQALDELAARARSRRVELLVFAPLPGFPARSGLAAPASLCLQEWYRPAWALDPHCRPMLSSRDGQQRRLAPVQAALQELAARTPNLQVFDPFPAVCPAGAPCSTHRGAQMLFTDSNHLNRAGALLVAERFLAFLAGRERSAGGGAGS